MCTRRCEPLLRRRPSPFLGVAHGEAHLASRYPQLTGEQRSRKLGVWGEPSGLAGQLHHCARLPRLVRYSRYVLTTLLLSTYYILLHTTYYILLTIYYLLLTTYYSPTHYSLLSADCLLCSAISPRTILVTVWLLCSPLSTDYLLHTTYYGQVLGTTSPLCSLVACTLVKKMTSERT